jgi:hypothetical protein
MWKEAVMTYFKELFQNLSGGTKERYRTMRREHAGA